MMTIPVEGISQYLTEVFVASVPILTFLLKLLGNYLNKKQEDALKREVSELKDRVKELEGEESPDKKRK